MFMIVAATAWLALAVLAMTGCAGRQADLHAEAARLADLAADRIDAGIDRLPADADPAAVRGLLPEKLHADFDRVVAAGASAVDAAAVMADELRVVAVENRAAEADLRADIAAGVDRWVLTSTQIGAAAKGINPAIGLAITAIGTLGGIIGGWKRGRKTGTTEGARQTAEIVNAGRFANPELNALFKHGPAHDAMRAELAKADPIVAATVRATKHE